MSEELHEDEVLAFRDKVWSCGHKPTMAHAEWAAVPILEGAGWRQVSPGDDAYEWEAEEGYVWMVRDE